MEQRIPEMTRKLKMSEDLEGHNVIVSFSFPLIPYVTLEVRKTRKTTSEIKPEEEQWLYVPYSYKTIPNFTSEHDVNSTNYHITPSLHSETDHHWWFLWRLIRSNSRSDWRCDHQLIFSISFALPALLKKWPIFHHHMPHNLFPFILNS